MSRIAASTIGSGTVPHASVLRPGNIIPGYGPALGYREGVQTVIVNPEEFLSSPTMKTSGVIVSNSGTETLTTLVSYGTKVDVYNLGGGTIFIGSNGLNPTIFNTYPIVPGKEKTFNIMAGVPLYATASGGSVDVRWAQY